MFERGRIMVLHGYMKKSVGGYPVALICLLILCGYYLVALHFVQDYSDPVGFVERAIAWGQEDGDTADRAPLYPILLYGIIRLVGRDWVFISNIPFILSTLALLAVLSRRVWLTRPIRGTAGIYAAWSGITAVMIFFGVRRGLLQQLVNPYREPLAFALMLLTAFLIWSGWQKKKKWYFGVAGLALGLATGIREVSFLMTVPIGIWAAAEAIRERRTGWKLWLCFGFWLVIGLLPLFWKNLVFSGHALVPAYSANRVATYSATGIWDIPIPGMSWRYFSRVAGPTLVRTYAAYTLFGMLAFFAGALFAIRDRHRYILLFLIPAVLTYFFFFSFYNRYMPRYVMTGELFGIPVMAYGAVRLVELVASLLREHRVRATSCLHGVVSCALGIWVLAVILPPLFRENEVTKVWNLNTIRSEILETVETPAIFMGGRHFCFRMSWLLDQSSYEYTRRFHYDYTEYPSLDKRLHAYGVETVRRFAEGNYYIDESDFSLARHWLRRTPVFDFEQLSVPLERYGRPLSGNLYKVELWCDRSVALRSEERRSADAMLMLDLGRPWDYPDRTELTGIETGGERRYSLTNGLQFVELVDPPTAKSFEFLIESDQPVPPEPFWRVIAMNEDLRVSFGMASENWGWNLVSESFFQARSVPRDSLLLFDRGTVQFPVFASSDHDVYADFRIEYFQEHEYWRSPRRRIKAAWNGERVTFDLPPRRRMGELSIYLGKGDGRLSWRAVELRTNLPSYDEQSTPEFRSHHRGYGCVKLYDIWLRAVPIPTRYPVTIDLGAPDDGRYIHDGFHGREQSSGQKVRWSKPHGALRTRLPRTDGPLAVEWRILPIRPESETLRPRFAINDDPIPDTGIEILEENGLLVYRYRVAPNRINQDDWNILSLDVPSFNPARDIESKDARDLGLFVERVVIDRF